ELHQCAIAAELGDQLQGRHQRLGIVFEVGHWSVTEQRNEDVEPVAHFVCIAVTWVFGIRPNDLDRDVALEGGVRPNRRARAGASALGDDSPSRRIAFLICVRIRYLLLRPPPSLMLSGLSLTAPAFRDMIGPKLHLRSKG